MKHKRIRLIHIYQSRGVTRRTIRKFLQYDPTLKSIYSLSSSSLSQLFLLPKRNAEQFYNDLHHPENKMKLKNELEMFPIITIVDENYPNMLKQIKDPPIVLYALGDISLLQKMPALSVIGTRNPSLNGKNKTNFILKPLINKDFLIISGMAKGIDSYSHRLTLNSYGKTIAVLGSGFRHIYPKQNRQLFCEIAKKGLVLSEYPPSTPPKKYHFPERNRIISGLSFGTLVIEAQDRSGTMITVDQALDQGREVYAVPDSPLIAQARGCNKLIQEGAKLVLSAQDIVEDWERIQENIIYSS